MARSTCRRALLLWRGPWKPLRQHVHRGHRFTIVWFRPAAVVCLYLPHAEEGKRGEEEEGAREFRETLEEIHRCLADRRSKHPEQSAAVILFTDANVELAPDLTADGRPITGTGVLEEEVGVMRGGRENTVRKRMEEMRFHFTEFCSHWKIRLINTFGPRVPTWKARQEPYPQKVLDYIGLTTAISGVTEQACVAEWISAPEGPADDQAVSDHKLVHVSVAMGKRRHRGSRKTSSLHQWEPICARTAATAFDRAASWQYRPSPSGQPCGREERVDFGWNASGMNGSRYHVLQTVIEEDEETMKDLVEDEDTSWGGETRQAWNSEVKFQKHFRIAAHCP